MDLAFCSNPQLVRSVRSLAPLGTSDHVMIQFELSVKAIGGSSQRLRRLWSYDQADFEKLNKHLGAEDWSPVTDAPDMDSAWEAWKNFSCIIYDKLFRPS